MKNEKENKQSENCTNDPNPKHIKVNTMMTPEKVAADQSLDNTKGVVTEEELVESVVEINPDINSMESRG